MLYTGGNVASVRVGPFLRLYVGDTVPLLVVAGSHIWLFHFVCSRDLTFHVACGFLRELVMSHLWQRLACFWKESYQTMGLHSQFVTGQGFECPSPDTAQCVWCLCLTMCTATGVVINTLPTNDVSSSGAESRKEESVVWSWPSVWEHVLPPLETTNEGELSFSSASNRVRGGEEDRSWWAVSATLV